MRTGEHIPNVQVLGRRKENFFESFAFIWGNTIRNPLITRISASFITSIRSTGSTQSIFYFFRNVPNSIRNRTCWKKLQPFNLKHLFFVVLKTLKFRTTNTVSSIIQHLLLVRVSHVRRTPSHTFSLFCTRVLRIRT